MLEFGNKQALDKFTWRIEDSTVSVFSFLVYWRSRVSSNHVILNTLARASCVFNLVLERWSLGAIETMLQALGILFRCQGLSMLTAMPSLIHCCSLPWMRHPCSTMTRVELDLHVKSIVSLASRGARRRNVQQQMES